MPTESIANRAPVLVCVGPSPSSADLVKAGQAMAANSKSDWFAAYVETPKMLQLPEAERNRAVANLRLAEQLGAETVTLRGGQIAAEIIEFARQHQVGKIVAGRPARHRWSSFRGGSPVDDLVRRGEDIDVLVTAGIPAGRGGALVSAPPAAMRGPDYEVGILYLAAATALCFLMYPYFDLPNLIMVYLLAVMGTAVQCGRGPAILNAVLSVLAFDFCFVPPRWSFTVADTGYVVTFAVMLLVAVVIGHLTSLIKRQAEAARLQERQTAALHALGRQLAATHSVDELLCVATQRIKDLLQCEVVALVPDAEDQLRVAAGDMDSVFHEHILKEMSVAQAAYRTGTVSGWGTSDSRGSENLYLPLRAASISLGVLAMRPLDPQSSHWLLPEQLRLQFLESLAMEAALALSLERLRAVAVKRPEEACLS